MTLTDTQWDVARERAWKYQVPRAVRPERVVVGLSGGVDSSAVLAAMSERVDPARIHTFAIGFHEPSFDESSYARQVAAQFGVNHHEQILDGDRLLQLLPEILDHLDEPLADVSIVPTYALARFAREQVTVALGGDGGDELFAGYDTFLAERFARPYMHLPNGLRSLVARVVERLPPGACCLGELCLDNFNQPACEQFGGVWVGDLSVCDPARYASYRDCTLSWLAGPYSSNTIVGR